MPTKKKDPMLTIRTTPGPATLPADLPPGYTRKNVSLCLSTSREVLIQACEALDERDETRGDPGDTLDRIASLWTAYLRDHTIQIDVDLDGKDVALMMALLKIARAQSGRRDLDNYIDGAGYLALAAEVEETI